MNYITCFCHLSASFLIFNDVKQEKEGLALKKKECQQSHKQNFIHKNAYRITDPHSNILQITSERCECKINNVFPHGRLGNCNI